VVDARKLWLTPERFLASALREEEPGAVVEEGTCDTMSFYAHDLPPDLEEVEPVSSSSSRVFFHMPIPISASRQPAHSTPQPFPSASTTPEPFPSGFPAQQAEGSEVHVEVEEVQQEVKPEVEEDVKQEAEKDMQQQITSVLCKGRADGEIRGGAGGEAQEKAYQVKKRRPDTSDDVGCQGRGKGAGAAGPKHEPTEMRNNELRRDCEAQNLSREERKMMAIMRHIEEMEHKEKAVKAAPRITQLEGRVGRGNENVGEKRRFRDACDTGVGGGVGGGAGGKKLSNKRKKGGLEGKGKEKAVGKRNFRFARDFPVSEADSTARKQQRGEEMGGEWAGGGAVKNKRVMAKCPHNRQRSQCKQCDGSSICEHNRRRNGCKQCGGSGICEHNRERCVCKQCGGSSICEHNRRRRSCKECGGSSICEHNRRRYYCKQCRGLGICKHNRQRRSCKECRQEAD
jgi:hypothetical protein